MYTYYKIKEWAIIPLRHNFLNSPHTYQWNDMSGAPSMWNILSKLTDPSKETQVSTSHGILCPNEDIKGSIKLSSIGLNPLQ